MHPIRSACARQRRAMRRGIAGSDSYVFFNLLTDDDSLNVVEALLPPHRERLFPPTETLSIFMAQALGSDRSCQNAVNDLAAKRIAGGLSACSIFTGAYCRARQRLPEAMVSTLARHTGQVVAADTKTAWKWQGRPVRLVDGTTIAMPDTVANQAAYPQPRTQPSGLGFPLCRLMALICLSSGAVLDAAIGRYQGKGAGEQTLLRSMLDRLNTGDILLGDALFATYFLLCELQRRGVDGLFEQYGARRCSTDFRRGHRLGTRDHIIQISKPKLRPPWMSRAQYDAAPASLSVREMRVGGKTLVTTMLSDQILPKAAAKSLYQCRWHAELDLRNLKTTLGMETLSCKTPSMAVKEIWVYLLAYNLIRRVVARAASHANTLPRHLSFKHAVQLMLAWRRRSIQVDHANLVALYTLLAKKRVGQRPGRIEPRAVKRRPKPFRLLTTPRRTAREIIRKSGHERR